MLKLPHVWSKYGPNLPTALPKALCALVTPLHVIKELPPLPLTLARICWFLFDKHQGLRRNDMEVSLLQSSDRSCCGEPTKNSCFCTESLQCCMAPLCPSALLPLYLSLSLPLAAPLTKAQRYTPAKDLAGGKAYNASDPDRSCASFPCAGLLDFSRPRPAPSVDFEHGVLAMLPWYLGTRCSKVALPSLFLFVSSRLVLSTLDVWNVSKTKEKVKLPVVSVLETFSLLLSHPR